MSGSPSSNCPPQLHLSLTNTTSFKRSFEQFGVDLDSPTGGSGNGANAGTPGPSSDGNDRKRARSEGPASAASSSSRPSRSAEGSSSQSSRSGSSASANWSSSASSPSGSGHGADDSDTSASQNFERPARIISLDPTSAPLSELLSQHPPLDQVLAHAVPPAHPEEEEEEEDELEDDVEMEDVDDTGLSEDVEEDAAYSGWSSTAGSGASTSANADEGQRRHGDVLQRMERMREFDTHLSALRSSPATLSALPTLPPILPPVPNISSLTSSPSLGISHDSLEDTQEDLRASTSTHGAHTLPPQRRRFLDGNLPTSSSASSLRLVPLIDRTWSPATLESDTPDDPHPHVPAFSPEPLNSTLTLADLGPRLSDDLGHLSEALVPDPADPAPDPADQDDQEDDSDGSYPAPPFETPVEMSPWNLPFSHTALGQHIRRYRASRLSSTEDIHHQDGARDRPTSQASSSGISRPPSHRASGSESEPVTQVPRGRPSSLSGPRVLEPPAYPSFRRHSRFGHHRSTSDSVAPPSSEHANGRNNDNNNLYNDVDAWADFSGPTDDLSLSALPAPDDWFFPSLGSAGASITPSSAPNTNTNAPSASAGAPPNAPVIPPLIPRLPSPDLGRAQDLGGAFERAVSDDALQSWFNHWDSSVAQISRDREREQREREQRAREQREREREREQREGERRQRARDALRRAVAEAEVEHELANSRSSHATSSAVSDAVRRAFARAESDFDLTYPARSSSSTSTLTPPGTGSTSVISDAVRRAFAAVESHHTLPYSTRPSMSNSLMDESAVERQRRRARWQALLRSASDDERAESPHQQEHQQQAAPQPPTQVQPHPQIQNQPLAYQHQHRPHHRRVMPLPRRRTQAEFFQEELLLAEHERMFGGRRAPVFEHEHSYENFREFRDRLVREGQSNGSGAASGNNNAATEVPAPRTMTSTTSTIGGGDLSRPESDAPRDAWQELFARLRERDRVSQQPSWYTFDDAHAPPPRIPSPIRPPPLRLFSNSRDSPSPQVEAPLPDFTATNNNETARERVEARRGVEVDDSYSHTVHQRWNPPPETRTPRSFLRPLILGSDGRQPSRASSTRESSHGSDLTELQRVRRVLNEESVFLDAALSETRDNARSRPSSSMRMSHANNEDPTNSRDINHSIFIPRRRRLVAEASVPSDLPPHSSYRNVDISAYHDGPFRASLARAVERERAQAAPQPSTNNPGSSQRRSDRLNLGPLPPPVPSLPPLHFTPLETSGDPTTFEREVADMRRQLRQITQRSNVLLRDSQRRLIRSGVSLDTSLPRGGDYEAFPRSPDYEDNMNVSDMGQPIPNLVPHNPERERQRMHDAITRRSRYDLPAPGSAEGSANASRAPSRDQDGLRAGVDGLSRALTGFEQALDVLQADGLTASRREQLSAQFVRQRRENGSLDDLTGGQNTTQPGPGPGPAGPWGEFQFGDEARSSSLSRSASLGFRSRRHNWRNSSGPSLYAPPPPSADAHRPTLPAPSVHEDHWADAPWRRRVRGTPAEQQQQQQHQQQQRDHEDNTPAGTRLRPWHSVRTADPPRQSRVMRDRDRTTEEQSGERSASRERLRAHTVRATLEARLTLARRNWASFRGADGFDDDSLFPGPSFFNRVPSRRHNSGDYMADEAFDSSYENLLSLSARLGEAKPKSTPQHVIAGLPTGFYKDWATPETDQRCPICLDDYKPLDPVLQLPSCLHWLHKDCLEQWLKGARTCPICRDELGVRQSPAPGGDPSQEAGPSGTQNIESENDGVAATGDHVAGDATADVAMENDTVWEVDSDDEEDPDGTPRASSFPLSTDMMDIFEETMHGLGTQADRMRGGRGF